MALPNRNDRTIPTPGRYRRHLTSDDESHIVELYLAGQTIYELGTQFEVHRDRISRVLEASGIDRRYHQIVDVDLDRAVELQRGGLNQQQVADELGVGRTTLVKAKRQARERGIS